MVNFLGRFVPNLAEITKPLNDLRKKDVSFIWGSPQKKAFEKVKDVLASDRVLASFDISKKTMVSADASSYGLGAVLKQEHEANEWRPVAFASRTLTKTEQGYAQIEKEALAITWACERFKDFVVGKTFLIETDHKPLVPIFTTKDLNDLTPRLQRYRMRMLQFSFHIFHTPGKDLITADALSRQPLPGHLPEDEELQEEVEHFVRSIVLHQSTTDDRLAKIALNQKLEPTLQNVAFYSKNGWPAKCQLSPLERSFYDVRDEIGEENGLLMRGLRVIIPSNMRKDVLNRIHAGHQGITKCRARAKDHVWWPGIGQEIQDMVKTCEKCIENQPLKHEPLIPNDFPERPWQKVGMDLFHYEGSEYLVVVDYFSRFIEVVRLTKLSSETVVDHCKAIFARHGIPDIVISDNGPQFRPSTTSAFTKFASEVGFRHITSSPKHPQSNGQAEAAVKIAKNLMKKNKDPVLALMEYRATPLANGLSPAELLFGRKIRTMVPCTSSSLTPKTVDQSKLKGEEEQRKMAQKTAFDRRHAATKKAELIAGEKVWVKDLRAWGSVLEKASAPRSYIVETPVGTYRRNSLLLASSQQQVDPSETSPDSELPTETEETPGNELPAEELQQLPAIAPEIKQLSPSPGKVSRYGRRYKRTKRMTPNPEGRAWLLVVPEKKKREIMKEYHNHMSNGHLGVAKTMYRIKSKYFWPSMLKNVSEFVKTCHLCQSRKGSNQLPSGLLQPIPPANFPFERIGIDFDGPLPSTKNRKKLIIVLTDYYTRYAETRAVSEATVKEVSKFLVEDIFLRHGAPQYLISDRGSQFTSNLIKEVMKTCKIEHCFTTSYHPQTNGLTERLNRTLINMLSMYVNTDQKNWDEILPFITHAYNTTIQETTVYSPFFLMFGREPTSLLDDRNISVDIDKDDYDEYIKQHLDKINRTRKLVINNTIKTQERMKKNYDKKHMERSYEPGELVAVWTPIRKIGKCQITRRENFHVVNASLPFGVLTLKTLYQYKLKLNYNRGTIFQLGVPLSNTIYHFKHVSNECKHGLGQNLSQRTRTAPKAFTHGNPCLHSLPEPQIFTCHHSNLTPRNFSLNPIANTLCPQHIKPQDGFHTHNTRTHTSSHDGNTHNPHNTRNTHAKRQQQRQTSACTTVKNNTIIPSTQNIEKIHATKQPHNRKTLRSFLKAVNTYKEFIPDHARLRTPLINLLKRDIMWVWDDECQKAFTNLKENLTTHPTLHLYQEGLPCQVYCNTSTFSITGVLKQVYPDGKTYTVQHFSRSLRSHERNYSDLELQCLAIVESVDNFRTYLKDRKFTIFSEHPALQWLKEIKAPSGRLFRWRLRLSRYEYEVRSINGVQQYETGVGTRIPFCGFLDAPLIQSQQSSPPGKSRVTIDHNKLRTVSRKGVLKTIVPSSLTTRLLKSVHTQHHHPNISKMTRLISAQYYWQNMTQDIAKQVKTCPTCRFARRIDEYKQPARKNTDTGTQTKQNSYIKHSVHTTQIMPKLPHPRQRKDHTSQPKPITADISLIKPLTIKQENYKPDKQFNHTTSLPKDIKQENCEPTNHSNSTIHK
ncbi:K02A2.6-like, partial [Cordylochernes scorpioides]